MQLIEKSHPQAELKTVNSPSKLPRRKLSAQWKVVEGKLRCFWVAENTSNTFNTSNHNH